MIDWRRKLFGRVGVASGTPTTWLGRLLGAATGPAIQPSLIQWLNEAVAPATFATEAMAVAQVTGEALRSAALVTEGLES